jgi:hypothetical protein
MPEHNPRTGQFQPTDAELENLRKVVELRRAGASFDAIAKEVGYADKSSAHKAWSRALGVVGVPAGEVKEARDTYNDRYERMFFAVWPLALGGNLRAMDRALRTLEHLRKLNGTDAPIEFLHHVGEAELASALLSETYLSDAALAERIERWRRENEDTETSTGEAAPPV